MTARTSRPGYLWYRRHTAAYLFYIFPRDKVENKIMTKARNHVLVGQTFDIGITTHLEGRLKKKHTQITWKQQTYFQKHTLLHTQYQYCFFFSQGLRVLSLPASVYECMRQSRVWPRDIPSPAVHAARITKFRQDVWNALVKIPIVFCFFYVDLDLDLQGQINF